MIDQTSILTPFFIQLLLTGVVWLYMYIKRIPFLQSLDLDPDQITPAKLVEVSPPDVANPSDNLKNLFEMPVVFYAMVLYFYVTQQVDNVVVMLAWGFVAFRVLHSLVHATVNKVMVRFGLYAVSSLCAWAMVAIGFARHLGG